MQRSAYEQEQTRKAEAQLRMLHHRRRISHSVNQTCRFFGISRAQFYIRKRQFGKRGPEDDEILEERLISSRKRWNLSGVKRKISNYPLRPRHRAPSK